ncbi:DUF2442 domain-containing protein [Piscirickettsiaceae bacterium NZ-RLO2]|nr:DUF2442 domain-containing protein [Piscirickettsiaceae bacterium NZ-RLO2]
MGILETNIDTRIKQVTVNDEFLTVSLIDGRIISTPIAWYPSLFNADKKQRENWDLAGGGYGIHWPDLDEDLSVDGMLRGEKAHN